MYGLVFTGKLAVLLAEAQPVGVFELHQRRGVLERGHVPSALQQFVFQLVVRPPPAGALQDPYPLGAESA